MRESFIFYKSFLTAIEQLSDKKQLKLYQCIVNFALKDVDFSSKLIGIEKAIFELIKPQIVANNERYLNGKKGGRPKKEKPMVFENEENKKTKTKPNVNVNVNDNENVSLSQEETLEEKIFTFDDLDEREKKILFDFARKQGAKSPRAYVKQLLNNGDFKGILKDEINRLEKLKKIEDEREPPAPAAPSELELKIQACTSKEDVLNLMADYYKDKPPYINRNKVFVPLFRSAMEKFKVTDKEVIELCQH